MKHTLFDLRECLFDNLLDDEEYIKESIELASKKAGCEILNVYTHKFQPQGVTGFAMLAESHLSIHTWPESKYSAIDIFTCGRNMKPKLASQFLIESLEASNYLLKTIARDYPSYIKDQIREPT